LIPVDRGKRRGNGVEEYKYCVHMYVNGKMTPVETIPGMGQRIKENDGGGKFNYDIFGIL
jgi:hypothetical protein